MNIHILHTQEQACIGCGAIEQWSTLYQAEDLPAPGKAHKLLPCHHVGPYDYVHKVELPPRLVPICTQCVTTHAAGADLYARWQETLQRKSEERRVFVKAVKESRLEDLA